MYVYVFTYSGICGIQAIVSMAPCLCVTDSLSPKYGKRSSTMNCTDRHEMGGERETRKIVNEKKQQSGSMKSKCIGIISIIAQGPSSSPVQIGSFLDSLSIH